MSDVSNRIRSDASEGFGKVQKFGEPTIGDSDATRSYVGKGRLIFFVTTGLAVLLCFFVALCMKSLGWGSNDTDNNNTSTNTDISTTKSCTNGKCTIQTCTNGKCGTKEAFQNDDKRKRFK
jgi:hypothetical protein